MNKKMSYTLSETIRFDQNHILSELRSLSFEPSVSITEHQDQVLVEGTLLLAGDGLFQQGEDLSEQYRSAALVQKVKTDESKMTFEHHFPLSISIASERVANKHDVEVYIEHIDYEMPVEGILHLTAELAVEGVAEKKEVPKKEEAAEVRVLPNPLNDWNGEQPKARTEVKPEEQEAVVLEESAQAEAEPEVQEVEQSDFQEEPVSNDEEELIEEIVEEVLAEAEVEEALALIAEEVREAEVVAEVEDEKGTAEIDEQEDSAFSRFIHTLEDQQAQIKIHIAQQDETLEMVAERYGVTLIQLMKTNQFESRRPFNRGELIWVPPVQTHSK
ncbi:hypothetical protein [Jeotgalibacillus aurantiacus]|uniref:hypothetical protein n=1 Tax=Jeotgalibacillus aurantiacus TaxID=2763266 RepID=UPI001D0AFA8F|nr:hypothetical protein [Jeotgalibacillus aurantiacus]